MDNRTWTNYLVNVSIIFACNTLYNYIIVKQPLYIYSWDAGVNSTNQTYIAFMYIEY